MARKIYSVLWKSCPVIVQSLPLLLHDTMLSHVLEVTSHTDTSCNNVVGKHITP